MPYKAIVFDLDGTLLDTLYDLGDSVNRVLSANGFLTHDIGAFRSFVGDGATMLITRALPENKRTAKIIGRCTEAFMRDYHKNWNKKSKTYEGIPELLDSLGPRGIKLAILSNKPHFLTEKCVEGFFSKWRFREIIGQRGCAPRKPDPAAAIEIAGKLDLRSSDFLFVGDSSIDMKTAIAAGMFPVGVRWGFRPAEELKAAGAGVIVDRPMDIIHLLD